MTNSKTEAKGAMREKKKKDFKQCNQVNVQDFKAKKNVRINPKKE